MSSRDSGAQTSNYRPYNDKTALRAAQLGGTELPSDWHDRNKFLTLEGVIKSMRVNNADEEKYTYLIDLANRDMARRLIAVLDEPVAEGTPFFQDCVDVAMLYFRTLLLTEQNMYEESRMMGNHYKDALAGLLKSIREQPQKAERTKVAIGGAKQGGYLARTWLDLKKDYVRDRYPGRRF